MKRSLQVTCHSRETTTRPSGHSLRTSSTGFILAKAQEKGLKIRQTRSRATVVHDAVPAECIEKVVGIREWREHFVPKPLCAVASSKNDAQKCLELTAAAARHLWKLRQTCAGATPGQSHQLQKKGAQGHLLRKKRIYFKIDLRIEGIPKDAVLEDQEGMSQIHEVGDKLRTGYQTESIINDLEKKGTSNMFSEASRRTIKELGNVELYELGEMSKTVQCATCAEDIHKKDYFIAHPVYAKCLRQNREERLKLDLRSCLSPFSSVRKDDT